MKEVLKYFLIASFVMKYQFFPQSFKAEKYQVTARDSDFGQI